MTHIFKKIFKPIKPPLAYSNPTPSIIPVLWMLWVTTSFSHMNPCVKLRRFAEPMGGHISDKRFTAKTPAGFRPPAQEITAENGSHLTALASAYPYRAFVGLIRKRYHGESSVFFANHIQGHWLSPCNTIVTTRSAVKVNYA